MNRKNTLVRLAPIVVIVLIIALSVSSHAETINESGIMYTDKAGDFICKLGGRYYYKATDGWAIAAYFYCSSGYSGPILVSDKEENVSYYTSYDNSVFRSIGTVVFDEKTYMRYHRSRRGGLLRRNRRLCPWQKGAAKIRRSHHLLGDPRRNGGCHDRGDPSGNGNQAKADAGYPDG